MPVVSSGSRNFPDTSTKVKTMCLPLVAIFLFNQSVFSFPKIFPFNRLQLWHIIYVLLELIVFLCTDCRHTGDVIMMLQRISVACLVESRIHRFFPWFYQCLKVIYFTSKDGRLHLVTSKITHDITE